MAGSRGGAIVSAHTPGEWIAKECPGGDIALYGENQRGDIGLVRTSNPHRNADAALIAAAPELLAALEGVASESTPGERAETIDGAANLTARDWIARAVDTLRAADTDDCPLPDTVGDVLDDLTRALRRIDAARAAIAKAKGE
jgi:hypothetical protein